MSFDKIDISNKAVASTNEPSLNERSGVSQNPTAKTSLGNKILNKIKTFLGIKHSSPTKNRTIEQNPHLKESTSEDIIKQAQMEDAIKQAQREMQEMATQTKTDFLNKDVETILSSQDNSSTKTDNKENLQTKISDLEEVIDPENGFKLLPSETQTKIIELVIEQCKAIEHSAKDAEYTKLTERAEQQKHTKHTAHAKHRKHTKHTEHRKHTKRIELTEHIKQQKSQLVKIINALNFDKDSLKAFPPETLEILSNFIKNVINNVQKIETSGKNTTKTKDPEKILNPQEILKKIVEQQSAHKQNVFLLTNLLGANAEKIDEFHDTQAKQETTKILATLDLNKDPSRFNLWDLQELSETLDKLYKFTGKDELLNKVNLAIENQTIKNEFAKKITNNLKSLVNNFKNDNFENDSVFATLSDIEKDISDLNKKIHIDPSEFDELSALKSKQSFTSEERLEKLDTLVEKLSTFVGKLGANNLDDAWKISLLRVAINNKKEALILGKIINDLGNISNKESINEKQKAIIDNILKTESLTQISILIPFRELSAVFFENFSSFVFEKLSPIVFEKLSEVAPKELSNVVSDVVSNNFSEIVSEFVSENLSFVDAKKLSNGFFNNFPKDFSVTVPQKLSNIVSPSVSKKFPDIKDSKNLQEVFSKELSAVVSAAISENPSLIDPKNISSDTIKNFPLRVPEKLSEIVSDVVSNNLSKIVSEESKNLPLDGLLFFFENLQSLSPDKIENATNKAIDELKSLQNKRLDNLKESL